jgi:hypothetical protein
MRTLCALAAALAVAAAHSDGAAPDADWLPLRLPLDVTHRNSSVRTGKYGPRAATSPMPDALTSDLSLSPASMAA